MKKHVEECWHPHCRRLEEQTIRYNLSSSCNKRDPLTLILRPNVQGLASLETDCWAGRQLNRKMWETHRLMAGL